MEIILYFPGFFHFFLTFSFLLKLSIPFPSELQSQSSLAFQRENRSNTKRSSMSIHHHIFLTTYICAHIFSLLYFIMETNHLCTRSIQSHPPNDPIPVILLFIFCIKFYWIFSICIYYYFFCFFFFFLRYNSPLLHFPLPATFLFFLYSENPWKIIYIHYVQSNSSYTLSNPFQ